MLFHVKQASLCTTMMTTRHHLELLPLNMDMPTRWKSNAISNAATGRTKANQRHRFNRPRRPWQANATSHSTSEGFAIRWREHVRTSRSTRLTIRSLQGMILSSPVHVTSDFWIQLMNERRRQIGNVHAFLYGSVAPQCGMFC